LAGLASGPWYLDPAHSLVAFEVPHYWGLRTVKGRFTRYAGWLDLRTRPSIELTVEASSLTTGNDRRDRHLRSADFFDVERHPYVRFVSDLARRRDDILAVRGELAAGGGRVELELEAEVRACEDGYEIAGEAFVMHSWLGMTWSPFGITRPYSKLIVAGRLAAGSRPARLAARGPAGPRARRAGCGTSPPSSLRRPR
jgi:polyisoprenoid-binding protein YceI